MTTPELPPLQRAVLPPEELRSLFRDLGELPDPVELQVRGAVRPASLAEAEQAMLSGEIDQLQLRYAYEDRWWCDTLRRVGSEFDLVRIEIPEQPPGPLS